MKFSNLGHPNRIWTVSAINGQLGRLVEIHKAIFEGFIPGDRLVYTGNYLGGEGAMPIETLDEILYFRRTLLAKTGLMPDDFVYLRGIQEELWGKMFQLQFAPDPCGIIAWVQKHYPEMDSILSAYGSTLDEAARVAREGIVNLTRWTGFLKRQLRNHAGHEIFFTILRRAAFTENRHSNDNNVLFVHAGVNPRRALTEQGDSFWWAGKDFNAMEEPLAPFRSVVRGFDPEHGGVHIGNAMISLDGGCGYGGKLVCARLSDIGTVQELIAA